MEIFIWVVNGENVHQDDVCIFSLFLKNYLTFHSQNLYAEFLLTQLTAMFDVSDKMNFWDWY